MAEATERGRASEEEAVVDEREGGEGGVRGVRGGGGGGHGCKGEGREGPGDEGREVKGSGEGSVSDRQRNSSGELKLLQEKSVVSRKVERRKVNSACSYQVTVSHTDTVSVRG